MIVAAIIFIAMVTLVTAAPPVLSPEDLRKAGAMIKLPSTTADLDGEEIIVDGVNATGPSAWNPGRVIVRLGTGAMALSVENALDAALAKLNGTVEMQVVMKDNSEGAKALSGGALKLVLLKFDEGADVMALAAQLAKVPGVLYAEPDYMMYPDAPVEPTEPRYLQGRQYYLKNTGMLPYYSSSYGTAGADIKAFEAWQYMSFDFGFDTSNVTIAVIDQGVAFEHPDLFNNMWINHAEAVGITGVDDDGNGFIDDVYGVNFWAGGSQGINALPGGYNPWENDYHGTHVAGTITAEWNGIGAAGVLKNAKIMSLKFLGAGGGYTFDAIRALDYAVRMGADLTSNSWGGGEPSEALADAIRASGMLFIAAAGNEGNNNDFFGHYPSSYANPASPYYCENVISVAATDANDNLTTWSNYGPESVHIAAPGHMIFNAYPIYSGGRVPALAWMSGTSMATPQVSAVAAALIAQDKLHPSFSLPQYNDPDPFGRWDTVKEVILNSAEKKSQLDGMVSSGGRVSMMGALFRSRMPGIAGINVTPGFSPEFPVTIDLSVTLDEGEAQETDALIFDHHWTLCVYDPYDWNMLETGITADGMVAQMTIDEPGVYYVRHEMYYEAVLVNTAYKMVAVIPPEAVVYVADDQDYGTSLMSQFNEYSLWLLGIPYFIVNTPVELPTNIENVVIWSTAHTTTGVLNQEDAEWIIDYLKNGGRLMLSSYEMLNMLDGYYGESAFAPDTAAELLELLKIEGYVTDYTYWQTGSLPWYEDTANVFGDSIIDAFGLHLDLEYDVWSKYMNNFGDAITEYGPGGYPIMLSLNGGAIDEPDRAAFGISYAGDDYRLIFFGAPIEAMQGWDYYHALMDDEYEPNGDYLNFIWFIYSSVEFLKGEGPDRPVAWFENPRTGGSYGSMEFKWGLMDVPETTHDANIWYRTDPGGAWLPVTLNASGDALAFPWTAPPAQGSNRFQFKLEVSDRDDPDYAAYDFEGPITYWPVPSAKGANAGVDRENGLINFYVNAEKPGTLYVYDLSGVMLFSRQVEEGLSTVVWDMTYNGKRIGRGLYAFRVVYTDGTGSKVGRVLINF